MSEVIDKTKIALQQIEKNALKGYCESEAELRAKVSKASFKVFDVILPLVSAFLKGRHIFNITDEDLKEQFITFERTIIVLVNKVIDLQGNLISNHSIY